MLPVILLVENRPDEEARLRRACLNTGVPCTLVTVRSAQEVSEYLAQDGDYAHLGRRDRPNLILLNLNSPGLDGLALLARLKSDANNRRLPVVVFSSSDKPEDVQKAYELGANSYVCKPRDPLALDAIMTDILAYWLEFAQLPLR